MNVFLKHLSEEYSDDTIVLVCNEIAWHKLKALNVPSNVCLLFIPSYTPEMNPIEQIRKQIKNPPIIFDKWIF